MPAMPRNPKRSHLGRAVDPHARDATRDEARELPHVLLGEERLWNTGNEHRPTLCMLGVRFAGEIRVPQAREMSELGLEEIQHVGYFERQHILGLGTYTRGLGRTGQGVATNARVQSVSSTVDTRTVGKFAKTEGKNARNADMGRVADG